MSGVEVKYEARDGERVAEVTVRERADGRYDVVVDGEALLVDWTPAPGRRAVSLLVDERYQYEFVSTRKGPERRQVLLGDRTREIDCVESLVAQARATSRTKGASSGEEVVAPIPGKVVSTLVEVGQTVDAGTPLLILEAMKMQNELRSSGPGTVAKLRVAAGDTVVGGSVLVVLTPINQTGD